MAESISEGTLKQWVKQKGDYVEADEEVATIETDKIDVSVNAPKAGVLKELFASEEDTVTVGQDLFDLGEGEKPAESSQPKQESTQSEQPKQENTQSEQPKQEDNSSKHEGTSQPESPKQSDRSKPVQSQQQQQSKAQQQQQKPQETQSSSAGHRGETRVWMLVHSCQTQTR